MRVSAFGTAVLLVGCGGGGDKDVSASSSTSAAVATTTANPSSTVASVATPAQSTATTGGRSAVPTTTLPPLADTDITEGLIPEHTTDYDFANLAINGVAYVNALKLYAPRTPGKIEINASRNRNRFKGTLGIPDDEASGTSVQVDISLDAAPPALSTVVSFGEAKEIDLDVSGVLRVRITISVLSGDGTPYVAIGNPRFA